MEDFAAQGLVTSSADEQLGKRQHDGEEGPVRAEEDTVVVHAVEDAREVVRRLPVDFEVYVIVRVGVLNGFFVEVHAGVAEDERDSRERA